jgi:hypothetical protein
LTSGTSSETTCEAEDVPDFASTALTGRSHYIKPLAIITDLSLLKEDELYKIFEVFADNILNS